MNENENENRYHYELMKCSASPLYFVQTYVRIYDARAGTWVPFHLWDAQKDALQRLHRHPLVIVLKARQLGLTWLTLSYALWQMLFRPQATVLLFSRREEEAHYLLGDERLRGMYQRLPAWLRARDEISASRNLWKLSNGSVARAFPTTSGDGYTASLAIVDEADLVPDLNALMGAVKPTIDAGGKLVLISRADKRRPHSDFKRIYRAGRAGINHWEALFLPYDVHPQRDAEWYAQQQKEIEARTGSLDALYEQYPATDDQALAPPQLDKRLPLSWLAGALEERPPLDAVLSDQPGLSVYHAPEAGRSYALGMDCAEGLPQSDESVTTVLRDDGVQVALLAGRFTPATHAQQTARLLDAYPDSVLLPEANNHGHAAILWLQEQGYAERLLKGEQGRPGWVSSARGKDLLYITLAEALREGRLTLHDRRTYEQLAALDASTLRAPPGEHDDRADALALALMGLERRGVRVHLPRFGVSHW